MVWPRRDWHSFQWCDLMKRSWQALSSELYATIYSSWNTTSAFSTFFSSFPLLLLISSHNIIRAIFRRYYIESTASDSFKYLLESEDKSFQYECDYIICLTHSSIWLRVRRHTWESCFKECGIKSCFLYFTKLLLMEENSSVDGYLSLDHVNGSLHSTGVLKSFFKFPLRLWCLIIK